MRSGPLELILFANAPSAVRQALVAGLRSCIIDLEWRGKEERQLGLDTEINRDAVEDLATLRELRVKRRYCRLNRLGPWTSQELEAALELGATHLLLPMVEEARQAEELTRLVDGRCALGILVETQKAVEAAAELAELPLDAVYVGLNDLAISRGSDRIFDAVVDGTVESLRETFEGTAFGFGGVTLVDRGFPIPGRLLLAEMARLHCAFSFLRRSFRRDVRGRDLATEIRRLEELWLRLAARSSGEVEADRRELCRSVAGARARTA